LIYNNININIYKYANTTDGGMGVPGGRMGEYISMNSKTVYR